MKNSTKRFALGTIIAAIAGFLAGILTAPKSGKETREDIKNAAATGMAEAEKQLKKLHTELNVLLIEAKDVTENLKGKGQSELKVAIDRAKDVKEKARELLSALHEGDADDKELKKAIAEATKAIGHLKSFLKK